MDFTNNNIVITHNIVLKAALVILTNHREVFLISLSFHLVLHFMSRSEFTLVRKFFVLKQSDSSLHIISLPLRLTIEFHSTHVKDRVEFRIHQVTLQVQP